MFAIMSLGRIISGEGQEWLDNNPDVKVVVSEGLWSTVTVDQVKQALNALPDGYMLLLRLEVSHYDVVESSQGFYHDLAAPESAFIDDYIEVEPQPPEVCPTPDVPKCEGSRRLDFIAKES